MPGPRVALVAKMSQATKGQMELFVTKAQHPDPVGRLGFYLFLPLGAPRAAPDAAAQAFPAGASTAKLDPPFRSPVFPMELVAANLQQVAAWVYLLKGELVQIRRIRIRAVGGDL